jgi:hypothetical protein
MYRLIDSTSGASSLGMPAVSSGVGSPSLRAATVADSRFSGRSPRPTPSHTIPSASTTSSPSCSSDPVRISRASAWRASIVSPTITHTMRVCALGTSWTGTQRGHPQLLAAIHDVVVLRDEQRAAARRQRGPGSR